MTRSQRLPTPYRPEADTVAARLRTLHDALDWAAAARVAAPEALLELYRSPNDRPRVTRCWRACPAPP